MLSGRSIVRPVALDNWWGAKTGAFTLPAPLEIRRPWVGDDAARLQMLVSNEADIGGPTTPSQLYALQAQNPSLKSYTDTPPIGWIDPCPRMLTVNTTVSPWDRKEMRWALSYAINRQQIVDVVNEGAGATSNFIFPTYQAMQPYLDAARRQHRQVRRPGRQDPLARHHRAALHGALGTHGRATVEHRRRRRRAAHPGMGRLPRPDRPRPVPGRDRLGWVRQHRRAVVRHEPLQQVVGQPGGTPGTEYVDNTNNAGRWVNDQYSALMDQMGSLPLGDPRVMDLYLQAVAIWADETPDISLVQPPSHWEHFLRV